MFSHNFELSIVTSDLISSDRLRIVSKDELSSRFCETPSSWGDRQNTPCLGFTKGPMFLNMVMTFVLHPLSHYNSIIEPHTRFILSFLEGLTIDFPSHFILSLWLSREFSTIFLSPIQVYTLFCYMCHRRYYR